MKELTIKQLIMIMCGLLVLVILFMTIHQQNHFNKNTRINEVAVGGLTAKQALAKLQRNPQTTKVYVNDDLVYSSEKPIARFSGADSQKVATALHDQYTFFPSNKKRNILIKPHNFDSNQLPLAKQAVAQKVTDLNNGRKAPVDAYAVYENGKVDIKPAVGGTQYSLDGLDSELDKDIVNGTVKLTPEYKSPLSANSKTVQNEKKNLDKLATKKVIYQVQNKKYTYSCADIISRATYQNGKYHFDTSAADSKVDEINNKQATLGKSFEFKTHDGSVIKTTDAGSYGWKISKKQAGKTLANALVDNKKTVNAKSDIYGKGYNQHGTGYDITSNNGIGDTYAEVSIADQHAWFYKDGKCVLSTDIVSGTNNKDNETPKGVWYIMYQQTPSVLRGLNDDGSKYASKVQYWSPFTDSGCGFHDASWRHDWSKHAYMAKGGGSHGCINMHPDVAGEAFHDLQKNEPVIIY
ncbi:L,D-transpeptidase family protein [Limosilactobacillus sp. STM2_1]|uniref:L,D-transpeptidase family protein n=1 Tax=Limosilactobacillus rudii TaxID=2759755 RepID=A0A7W3UJB1_9LACO|nr:L,D-transpeptidase family protein [Limosilactobacillus rudii]MBB1078416.1 L,D-transpeptidase family protein [Limosilactobacillus rudii]MBB1096546.1 L,D-transpeptidase family protein [Limosilactobacillus rudii]MCD7134258.1 L,D-transpeptidase/peptidoglycan binding protein [Limosilactobacillus rudii]